MKVKFDLNVSVCLLGLEIWPIFFKFNSGLIEWPLQPPVDKVPKINKIVYFWWSIFTLRDQDRSFWCQVCWKHKTQHFFVKWGCWGHWGHWGCWGCQGHWGCRDYRAWKITTEDSRVIQVLKFSFIWCFENNFFSVESWNLIFQFLHLFCWRLLRPA